MTQYSHYRHHRDQSVCYHSTCWSSRLDGESTSYLNNTKHMQHHRFLVQYSYITCCPPAKLLLDRFLLPMNSNSSFKSTLSIHSLKIQTDKVWSQKSSSLYIPLIWTMLHSKFSNVLTLQIVSSVILRKSNQQQTDEQNLDSVCL